MKLKVVVVVSFLLSECMAIPIFQPQFGILASNSNEILRLNGLTLSGVGFGRAQAAPFIPSFGIQPDLGLPPQLVPLNPQLAAPFLPQVPPVLLPAQANQLPPAFFPPSQQEQPPSPQDPIIVQRPQQSPPQVVPQFYFPQYPGAQRFPYYFQYGYSQQNPSVVQQQPTQPNGQQNLEQTTQTPNLLLQVSDRTRGQGEAGQNRVEFGKRLQPLPSPPEKRGDATGTEEGPNLSFVFEP